jgi:hypothetical protein
MRVAESEGPEGDYVTRLRDLGRVAADELVWDPPVALPWRTRADLVEGRDVACRYVVYFLCSEADDVFVVRRYSAVTYEGSPKAAVIATAEHARRHAQSAITSVRVEDLGSVVAASPFLPGDLADAWEW